MSTLSRRRLLEAMSALGAYGAFGRLLQGELALAQTAPPPLRLVVFFTPHGQAPEYWRPQGGETDFSISYPNAMLAPLERHRSRLLVLDGLDYRVLYEQGAKTGHEGGPVAFLTGSRLVTTTGDERPASASLDQALASAFGSRTRFRSLELLAFQQFPGQSVYNTVSFRADGTRVPFERDPAKVYLRLFGDMAGDPAQAGAALARKQSLLDFLLADANRLSTQLGAQERLKMDAHMEALRDIERRLQAGFGVGCVKPTAPSTGNLGDNNNMPALTRLQMGLIARAFACDLTRFVTMPIMPESTMPWIGVNVDIHNEIAHRVDAADPAERTRVRLELAKVQTWYAEQMAWFMDALASIPEGSGSVLDNTLIVWGNELGDPAGHSNIGVPTVLMGGAGGKFRMGRYLRLRPDDPNLLQGWSNFGDPAPKLVAHNRLLVSIAQAFGLQVDTFGHPAYTGTLNGLT